MPLIASNPVGNDNDNDKRRRPQQQQQQQKQKQQQHRTRTRTRTRITITITLQPRDICHRSSKYHELWHVACIPKNRIMTRCPKQANHWVSSVVSARCGPESAARHCSWLCLRFAAGNTLLKHDNHDK